MERYAKLTEGSIRSASRTTLVLCGLILGLAIGLKEIPAATAGGSGATYWVAYQGGTSSSNAMKFLLAIDSFGNVLVKPKGVVLGAQFGKVFRGIAVSLKDAENLEIWAPSKRGEISQFTIKKSTLTLLSSKPTGITTTNPFFLQVTQRSTSNFLCVQQASDSQEFMFAFQLDSAGIPVGSKVQLSSQSVGELDCVNDQQGGEADYYCGGSISSDGRAATLIQLFPSRGKRRLFLQRITSQVKPKGDPLVVTTMSSRRNDVGGIGAADISGVLSGHRRFLIYTWGPQSIGSLDPEKMFLQVIDSSSGTNVGKRITAISNKTDPELGLQFTFASGQSIGIDPLGKFLLFADSVGNLFLKSLDASGHSTGKLKILASNVFPGGLDLVRE